MAWSSTTHYMVTLVRRSDGETLAFWVTGKSKSAAVSKAQRLAGEQTGLVEAVAQGGFHTGAVPAAERSCA